MARGGVGSVMQFAACAMSPPASHTITAGLRAAIRAPAALRFVRQRGRGRRAAAPPPFSIARV